MYCLESKISKQVLLTRKLYCVPSNDDAELIRKLNAVNSWLTPALSRVQIVVCKCGFKTLVTPAVPSKLRGGK